MEQLATARISAPDSAAQDTCGVATLVDQQELACCWQPDTTLTYVNEAYCRYFGKSAAELLGQSFLSLVPEDERGAIAAQIDELVSALTVEQLIRNHRTQGRDAIRTDSLAGVGRSRHL